jgi:hypothetical protein
MDDQAFPQVQMTIAEFSDVIISNGIHINNLMRSDASNIQE